MKKSIFLFGCAFVLCSQLAHAGVTINGGISGNNGSGGTGVDVGIGISADGNGANGGHGVGVIVDGNTVNGQQPGASDSQIKKDIYASICSSPFMKKYAAICK